MRKIYSLLLLLTTFLFTGNLAYAYTLTLKWETPGSVEIKAGNIEYWAKDQDVSGKTEYQYSFGTYDNLFVAVSPASGYSLVKAVQNEDNSVVVEPDASGRIVFNGNGYSTNLIDKTYTIYCEKVALNDKFNINVINGLDYIKAAFTTGGSLSLEKGNHSYAFNAATDGELTITPQGIPMLYSVTLDGNPVQINNNKYTLSVSSGSNVVIQAFENVNSEAPETCRLTFEYGPNMEGCIYTIRDWTTSKFVEGNVVNNVLDIQGYSDLQLNFVEKDYTVTKVYLNGENITDLLQTSSFDKSQKIRFTVPNKATATIKIEGTATVYGNLNFTGYIMGAEGVEFSATYGGTALTMPAGESFTGSYSVGSYTLDSSNSQKYTITVSEKIGKVFFRPKAGYYIADLYTTLGSTTEQHSGSASLFPTTDGTTFYMVVKKLPTPYTFDLTTTGSIYTASLAASNPIIDCWDNPEVLKKATLSADKGTESISFSPGYTVPLVISVFGDDTKSPAAYLDGAALTGVLNTDSNAIEYTFTPYSPEEGNGIAAGAKSDVQVYLSTARPSMSGASLELEDGVEAEFFYSIFRHVADPAGQQVISGTQMIVKPANPEAIVTYKDEVVTLNENGEFVFNATGNARNNVVTISLPAKYSDMLVEPADGATVKTLSTVKVTLPCVDPNFESMMDYNEEVLTQLTVKNGDEVVATFGELGDPNADDEGNTIVPIILSAPITAAGTYTINIPEKAFVQKAWSEADDAMVAVKGGFVTPAYNGAVTVDPNMISVCDNYTLTPASGETVEEISVVKISFNQISAEEYFSSWEFEEATFTNGETTVKALVNYDWMGESENRVMNVTPIDDEKEPIVITTPGTWTMTIAAGTFSYNGETNGEITAEYTIAAQTSPYTITPESGSVVEDLSSITIEFPGVTTIEYNDTPITMVGEEYNASTTDVAGTGNSRKVSFRNPTAGGEYTVTFPAGAFTLDGKASEEATAVYTFQPSYLLTPASGSTLKSFEVAISFPNATKVEYVGGVSSIVLTNNSSYASPSINCVKDATASVPTFVLTLPESAQKPALGNYDLIIDEGAFNIDGKENTAIFASYLIEPDVTAEYQIDPNGTIVYSDWGLNFALIFDEAAAVTTPAKSSINLTFDSVAVPASAFDMMAEGNYLMFMIFDPQYNKEGVLNLKIAEGAFKVGGKASPAVDATWNVVAPKTYSVNVNPANENFGGKYQYIETILINFPDATEGEIFNEYGARLGYQTGTITKVEAESANLRAESTGVTFAVTFPKISAKGNYDLWVMEGTFTLDGAFSSPEINATFAVDPSTAVAEIFADENGNITVYSIDGKLILNNVPAAEIHNMQKGIYIINGKKVMLK